MGPPPHLVAKSLAHPFPNRTDRGSSTTIAAGSMATELATGRTLAEALRIGQEDVLDTLEGLPDESKYCASLAATTLKEAIGDYLAPEKEPWNS